MKKTSRNYYLHSKVKELTTINSHESQVEVSDELIRALTVKQKYYLDELLKLGYNLQYRIL